MQGRSVPKGLLVPRVLRVRRVLVSPVRLARSVLLVLRDPPARLVRLVLRVRQVPPAQPVLRVLPVLRARLGFLVQLVLTGILVSMGLRVLPAAGETVVQS